MPVSTNKQARKARAITRFARQRFGRKRRMEDLRLPIPKSCPRASLFYINHRQRLQQGDCFLDYALGPLIVHEFGAVIANHDKTDFITI